MRERDHHLVLQVPPESLRVSGDPTRLTQALGNVLGNAAKYTDSGGHIELSWSRSGADVEIRVRDNGIGIPGDLLVEPGHQPGERLLAADRFVKGDGLTA